MTRERIERFFKNLAPALGHCIFEDADVLGMVIPALVCVGILWLIGVAVYDLSLIRMSRLPTHWMLSPLIR
jgi:hypothetical protein